MGKAVYWILVVITAIFAAGIFYVGVIGIDGAGVQSGNNIILGIIFSFIAIIVAAIADRHQN